MDNQTKIDHDLIESLLSALDAPSQESIPKPGSSDNGSFFSSFSIQAANEFKILMDQMPGGFFIYHADEDEKLIYANRALLRIFNCDTMKEFQELTGNSFRGIVHPEDLEEVEKSIWEQIAQSHHDLDYVEYRIVQKGGAVRWVEDYGHFIHSETCGDIFYVFVGDATEKKERQEAEHLQRLEVIEGLSINYESILYANLDDNQILPYRLSSRVRYQFQEIFRTCRYDLFLSEYLKTWVHPDDQDMVACSIAPDSIRRKLSSCRSFYINFRTIEDGEIQYLQLLIARVGTVEHISCIVLGSRRIDDEIQHEIEQKKIFEDAWNQARLANITKSRFLSNMSHDMRTPLNAITGFSALARKNINDPEKVLNYLDKIDMSSDHLLRLVNHILEISRLESGSIEVLESEGRLQDIIEDLKKNILPRAKAKDIAFSVDLSSLIHDMVYCDSAKIVQILVYLAGNAVKYTGNGGHVLLTVTEESEPATEYALYHFSVEDDGIGIDKKYLKSIFEPFERVSDTTSCGVFGTGLGLTLARNLVEMMSGKIDVTSTPGIGSIFTMTIRLRIRHNQEITYEEAQENVRKLLNHRKILLVDDNELNLEIETELLQEIGISTDTAENGQEAIDKLTASPAGTYALILMDIQMPIMNGYDAARTIRSLSEPALSGIPIIALSANAFDEDRRRSMESGMNAHMAKPLDMAILLELLSSIIRPE